MASAVAARRRGIVGRLRSEPHKYALVERERRFLLADPSPISAGGERVITDRYLDGTRLRLRRVVDRHTQMVQWKLTKKVPSEGAETAVHRVITTIDLSADEYERLSVLPGALLQKTRHRIGPMLIDVYDPPLDGLVLAEAEFENDDAANGFEPPAFVLTEVTGDPRFTGGRLARTSREELLSWLDGFGITLV